MVAVRSITGVEGDPRVARFRVRGVRPGWLLRLFELPAGLAVVALSSRPEPDRFGAIVALLVVACAAWVAWLVVQRRARPGRTGRLVWILFLVIVVSSGVANELGAQNAAVLTAIAAVNVGMTCDIRSTVTVVLAATASLIGGGLLFAGPDGWKAAVFTSVCVIAAAGVGVGTGLRIEQLRQTSLLLEQQKLISTERERAGALAERSRIAREIHDILAHSLADLSIQLEVADALLTDRRDDSGAVQRVRRAHRIARDGIAETRRAIQALRNDSPPLPDALAVIAGACRRDGRQVALDVAGAPRALEPAAGLALLRAAQESLANAEQHAKGAATEICLRYETDRVLLTVTDVTDGKQNRRADLPSSEAAGGYGLAGMAERLRLVGGSLSAGPTTSGWSVYAEVPA